MLAESRKRLAAPARREQILEAAAALFVERGFEAVVMADIAHALGISRPAVYSYFASTEAVLDALLQERLGQLWTNLEGLLPATAAGGLPGGRYAALFTFLTTERETLLLLHSGGGPVFQARRGAFLAELGQRLERQYPQRRPYQMTLLTHLLDSVAYFAVQQHLPDVDALAATLDQFLRSGLAGLNPDVE